MGYQTAVIAVAVVFVAMTRLARSGSIVPAATPVKVTATVSPAMMTATLPAPPTHRPREVVGRSVESLGVTAAALSAGELRPDARFAYPSAMLLAPLESDADADVVAGEK
jgi:hypothetical protein